MGWSGAGIFPHLATMATVRYVSQDENYGDPLSTYGGIPAVVQNLMVMATIQYATYVPQDENYGGQVNEPYTLDETRVSLKLKMMFLNFFYCFVFRDNPSSFVATPDVEENLLRNSYFR